MSKNRKQQATRAARPKAMNPLVTLRASTIPSAKREASRKACRNYRYSKEG